MDFLKLKLLLMVQFVSILQMFSQLVADAGSDLVLCSDQYQTYSKELGGNPSALGGTGDYKYTWEATFDTTFFSLHYFFTASFFLDDTTKANPQIINTLPTLLKGNSLQFRLTVQDGNGNMAKDNVDVVFSQVTGISLTTVQYYINSGDSVLIDAEFGGIELNLPIDEYIWVPGTWLQDSTSTKTWAKPENSIDYSLMVVDSGLCQVFAGPFYSISVITTHADSKLQNSRNLRVYPNPVNESSIIELSNNIEFDNYLLKIIDNRGGILCQEFLKSNIFSLSFLTHPGIYHYLITLEGKNIFTGSFIKN